VSKILEGQITRAETGDGARRGWPLLQRGSGDIALSPNFLFLIFWSNPLL